MTGKVRFVRGAVAVLSVVSVGVAPVLTAAPAMGEECLAQQADRGPALEMADACDAPVAITSESTPWSTAVATPEGTVRLTVTPAAKRTRLSPHAPGDWAGIDTRFTDLDPGDGRIDVTAPVFGMSVSDGGKDQPLAIFTTEQGVVVVDVPFRLPAPRVAEDTVTYDDVVTDGVNLVVTVTPDGTGLVPSLSVDSPDAWREARDQIGGLELAVTTTEGLSLAQAGDGLSVSDLAGVAALSWTGQVAVASDPGAGAGAQALETDLVEAGARSAANGRDALADLAVDAFAAGRSVSDAAMGSAISAAQSGRTGVEGSNGSVSGLLGEAVDTSGDGANGLGSDPNANRIAEAVRADALSKAQTVGVRVDAAAGFAAVRRAADGASEWPMRLGLGTVAGTQAGWSSLSDDRNAAPGAGFLAGPELPAGGRSDVDRRIAWTLAGLGEIGLSDPGQVRGARFTVPATAGCGATAEISSAGAIDPDLTLVEQAGAWKKVAAGAVTGTCSDDGEGTSGHVSFDVTEALVEVAETDTTSTTLGLAVPETGETVGVVEADVAPEDGALAKGAMRSGAKTLEEAVVADPSMTTFAADEATLTVEFTPSAETLAASEASLTTDPDSLEARKVHEETATSDLPTPSAAPSAEATGTPVAEPSVDPDLVPSDDLPVAASATIPVGTTATTQDVGGMNVTVQAPADGSAAPSSVEVTVHDQTVADAEGVTGVVLALDDASATTPAAGEPAHAVDVAFDYTDFADVAGAGWADRLGLLRIPACAEITPDAPECQPEQIPTSNDPVTSTVTATVELPTQAGVQALAAAESEAAAIDEPSSVPSPSVSPTASSVPSPQTSADVAEPADSPSDNASSSGGGSPSPEVASMTEPSPSPSGSASTSTSTANAGVKPASYRNTESVAATSLATSSDTPAPPTAQDRYAIVSGTQSKTGNWGATPLSASSSWSVSGNTGSFSWSYPIGVPKPMGGPSPDLSLGYSTGSLDGMVTDSNTQSSAVGLGWDMTSGFIERRFVPCSQDREAYPGRTAEPNNSDRKTGDLCWGPADAVSLVFNGHSGELIREGAVWRPRNDDGTRVRLLTGGDNRDKGVVGVTAGEQAADGEYWEVTTTDGVRYYFGRDRRFEGDTLVQDSTWTVPVYANHPGEPGYDTAFKNSDTRQAWRWNLDYVVDPAGRSMTYLYTREQNRYGADLDRDGAQEYDRGGYLEQISYGTLAGREADDVAPYRVEFTYAERCLLTSGCGSGDLAKGTAWRWHDTPTDLSCTSSTSCKQVMSPAFFTRKRLTQVTTKVRDAGAYQPVDQYNLTHRWKDPGDGTNRVLWLQSVTHNAIDNTPADDTDNFGGQKTWFTPTAEQLPGRAEDTVHDGWPRMYRLAMQAVHTPAGATISVNYRPVGTECAALPADPTLAEQKANNAACLPVTWTPAGHDDEVTEWFHKHLVESIVQNPGAASTQPAVETSYEYLGGAHWARTPSALSPLKDINYAEFRGFQSVKTYTGQAGLNLDRSPRGKSVTEYFRGTGGNLESDIDGGVKALDHERFAGMPFRTTVYQNAASATPVSETIAEHTVPMADVAGSEEQVPVPSATNKGWNDTDSHDADDTYAWRITSSTSWTKLFRADGATSSIARTTSSFDQYGRTTQVSDVGGVSVTGDELCTTTSYVENGAKHLLAAVQHTRTIAAACESSGSLVSAQQFAYDGGQVGDAPTRGLPTKSLMPDPENPPGDPVGAGTPLTAWVTAQSVTYESESEGRARPLQVSDALGRMSETAYADSAAGVLIGTTTTSPDPDGAGSLTPHTTTTVLDPLRALPVKVTDPNGRVTEAQYDIGGRLLKVWMPDRDRATQSSSMSYTYTIRPGGINAVRTSKLGADGTTRHESSVIYDGLLRQIQTQRESASTKAPGRVVTSTVYDEMGRVHLTAGEWYLKGDASDKFLKLAVSDEVSPVKKIFEYDGTGRVTVEILHSGNINNSDYELSRTTTVYDGKFTRVTPPQGGTRTTTVTDARGRTVELRQYTSDSAFQATTYGYDPEGRLAKVVEKTTAKAIWQYRYDLLGREVWSEDPARGVTTTIYDLAGQIRAVTDATGDMVSYRYDKLGRKTAMYDANLENGVVTDDGLPRAEWVFDRITSATGVPGETVVKGQATATIRHLDGYDYVTSVSGVDAMGRPTGSRVHIPARDLHAGVSGTYETKYSYMADGQVEAVTLPAAGSLGKETVTTYYDSASMPEWMGGGFGWGTYVAASERTVYGEQSWMDLGNTYAAVVSYEYDEFTRRLSNISVDRERISGTDLAVSYTYDKAGNVLSQTDMPSVNDYGVSADGQCFEYDALGRMTEAWTPAVIRTTGTAGKAGTANCTTNQRQVALLEGPAKYWDSWEFDGSGNRTKWTHQTPSADETITTYTYGNEYRPHRLTGVSTNAPTRTVTDTITYDEAGNTKARKTKTLKSSSTSSGATLSAVDDQQFEFDPESELAKITTETTVTEYPANAQCKVPVGENEDTWCLEQAAESSSGTQIENDSTSTANIYSADGERLLRINRAGGTVTGVTAYIGGGQELRQDAAGEVTTTRYYTFAGQNVAIRTGKGMKNVHSMVADHHGTPLLSIPNTDWASRSVIRHRTYPFGAGRTIGGLPGDHRFLGKTRDATTGYTLVGARWYDEDLGRFLSVDPILNLTNPQAWNGYTYSNNSPVTHSDPTGLEMCLADCDYMYAGERKVTEVHVDGGNGGGLEVESVVVNVTPAPPELPAGAMAETYQNIYDEAGPRAARDWLRPFFERPLPYGFMETTEELQWSEDVAAFYCYYHGEPWECGESSTAVNVANTALIVFSFFGVRGGPAKSTTGGKAGSARGATNTAAGAADDLAAMAARVDVDEMTMTKTVSNHFGDIIKKGVHKGDPVRPFMKSRLVVKEIMAGSSPKPDPQGAAGALRWDTPGRFRGSDGMWELVVDTEANQIMHFNFVGGS
ncbi:RHS repeat-associated core domain-containing protein [Myceligenerans crystallogenes]|uniref:RHS repeat-associated core domain-containing protein n=1 Tax=Myceligenerans crystallogenes TaxID=316335 RepID=A0ABP4ZIK3_9MICO